MRYFPIVWQRSELETVDKNGLVLNELRLNQIACCLDIECWKKIVSLLFEIWWCVRDSGWPLFIIWKGIDRHWPDWSACIAPKKRSINWPKWFNLPFSDYIRSINLKVTSTNTARFIHSDFHDEPFDLSLTKKFLPMFQGVLFFASDFLWTFKIEICFIFLHKCTNIYANICFF